MESQRYCEICEEMLTAYRRAVAELGRITNRLTEASLSREQDLYLRTWNEARAANRECTTLRKAILEHLESHQKARWMAAGA